MRIFLRTIESTLRRVIGPLGRHGRVAAVSFHQRFGSSLNQSLHFHFIVSDGLWIASAENDGPHPKSVRFVNLPPQALGEKDPPKRKISRRWALLMARNYEVFPLLCPRCQSPMKLIAFLTDPNVIRPILASLGEPTEPFPIASARGPPETSESSACLRHVTLNRSQKDLWIS